ncbi:recombinase family protein [Streptomyces sp. NPDC005840]|uniref:recombinase family protein n=1 Tax=Streptomyces sp. NPDC005840 TaxID=3157072 RepID=UPI0033ED134D
MGGRSVEAAWPISSARGCRPTNGPPPARTSSWPSRDRGRSRLRGGPGTSSHFRPLQRPKFGELLTYARSGDTVHISEVLRLVRGNQHIPDVLEVLHRDQLALRIHDGALSAMDPSARHPRTGELLSTVKFTVQTLADAGELQQRDLQRELTHDGLRAAEAKGTKGGRRPVLAGETAATVRTAFLAAGPSPPRPASTTSAAAPYAPPSTTSRRSTSSRQRRRRRRSCP